MFNLALNYQSHLDIYQNIYDEMKKKGIPAHTILQGKKIGWFKNQFISLNSISLPFFQKLNIISSDEE